MIGSLMYLTSSMPDIMFAVCACARFQVSPKTSNLLAVKRIFRYLKGKPSLGFWYSKDSPLELVAYTDSDYAGATQDRKSTTGGFDLWKGFSGYKNQLLRLWLTSFRINNEFEIGYSMMHYLRGGMLSVFKGVGFSQHTANGHQFTMSYRHQELTSPEQTASV
ncbi:hypothetical protein Tco_0322315 [Tanacetum coccineum]